MLVGTCKVCKRKDVRVISNPEVDEVQEKNNIAMGMEAANHMITFHEVDRAACKGVGTVAVEVHQM